MYKRLLASRNKMVRNLQNATPAHWLHLRPEEQKSLHPNAFPATLYIQAKQR